MAATFPGGVKIFTTKQSGEAIASAHINDLQNEVVAIETELKKTTGSTVDHGGLAGLGDNDHPQYLLTTAKAADSDKLDGIDSTGFATSTHNHDHGSLTGLAVNDHPQYRLANSVKMTSVGSLADDTAISITPTNTQGILFLRTLGGDVLAAVFYDAISPTAYCSLLAGTTTVEIRTGVLSGTTGTDGKFTISAHTDGKIYLENRRGSTLYPGYMAL